MNSLVTLTPPQLEALEPRIAPAVLLNPSTVQYVDLDNDIVTVKFGGVVLDSDPAFLDAVFGKGFVDGKLDPQQLESLNLTDAVFQGASVTITAKASASGDGFVNVGEIVATGNSLGKVTIGGDLGRIVAGAADTTVGLSVLKVDSLGRFETSTGAVDLFSSIKGNLTQLQVRSDVATASVEASGKIDVVTIGGSLLGGSEAGSGAIVSLTSIGKVTIGGDIQGGTADSTGALFSSGNIATIVIRGGIQGGDGDFSGTITSSANIAKITIGGNVEGGMGDFSGRILATNDIGSATIRGNLQGGDGDSSGQLSSINVMGKVAIGGNLQGGGGEFSGLIFAESKLTDVKVTGNLEGSSGESSGQIFSNGSIGRATIAGSVLGGAGLTSGSIFSEATTSEIKITGSLQGGGGEGSGQLFLAGAVGKIFVGGNVQAGSGDFSGLIFGESKIGEVKIGGSVLGGIAEGGGQIYVEGDITKVTIGVGLQGGSGDFAGQIVSEGKIGTVTIGTNVAAGAGASSGSIRVADTLGTLVIKGNLTGSDTQFALITAGGSTNSLAIGKISVGQSVNGALILAGYGIDDVPNALNADVQIGAVAVGGNWIASSLVAGAENSGFPNFGDANDTLIPGGDPTLLSRIASITIKGYAMGTVGGTDHYGFVAQEIGKVAVGGNKGFIPSLGFTEVGVTNDFKIHILPG